MTKTWKPLVSSLQGRCPCWVDERMHAEEDETSSSRVVGDSLEWLSTFHFLPQNHSPYPYCPSSRHVSRENSEIDER